MKNNEESKIVKIAITSSRTTLDSKIDPRFGRARYIILYDMEKEELKVLDNEINQQAAGGAGIQAAETVANSGAEILLTGHCGPKAFRYTTHYEINYL